jgi:hypothetical protein
VVECDQSSSDDETKEVYTTKMIWPKQAKSLAYSSLQPVQKKHQEEVSLHLMLASVTKYSMSYSKWQH